MEEYQFEWWHLFVIVPVWIIGAWISSYVRSNYNDFRNNGRGL